MRRRPAYALATTLILLGVAMFGAAALATVATLESKISRSQLEGTEAYAAAEAGVQDAVRRLETDGTYQAQLASGSLNAAYAVTGQPEPQQGFTVTVVTPVEGAGHAVIEVTGTSDNGAFTARRRLRSTVYRGPGTSSIGNNAFLAAGSLSVTNSAQQFKVTGGDLFADGSANINSATINLNGNKLRVVGSVGGNGGTANGTVESSNNPPAPAVQAVPGFDFTSIRNMTTAGRCTGALYASTTHLRCTPAQFTALIGSSGSFSFPSSVQTVYVDSNLSFGNNPWRNKSVTVNGLFVIDGDSGANAPGFTLTVNDPGTGRSGLIQRGNANMNKGTYRIGGVFYVGGSYSANNTDPLTVNGAMVVAGAVNVNTGGLIDVTLNSARVDAVLGGGTPGALKVAHWEEEY